ncbi:MAG: hypothetical protein C0407_04885 [Desulfobacca sp.]|nr:hypothetical protein [Desulfobacca sp.]
MFRKGLGVFFDFIKISLLGFVILSLIRCSAVPLLQPLILQGSSHILKPGDVVETATGEIVSFQSLINNLSEIQIIYVGETHTRIEDHRLQLEILKGLQTQHPSLILALEMFPREAQPILDQYSQGLISEKEFLENLGWEKNWGYPFDLYRGIFHWARARRLKMVGLNAPIEIVNLIAQKGLGALRPGERRRVALDFHLDHLEHQEILRRQYAHHPQGKIKNFETFYEAQLAWEETMAETLAQTLKAPSGEGPILVLVGRGHIVNKLGLPRLVQIRKEHTFKTILSIPSDYPFRTLDPKMADYLWITDASNP